MIERRKCRKLFIGNVGVGGDAPVSVQSMTKTATVDADATLVQIEQLREVGCEIVRVAVPTRASISSFRAICDASLLPVVADVHFSSQIAVEAAESGAAAVRINPGNLKYGLEKVIAAAKAAEIPIRIGVNSGSVMGFYRGDEQGGLKERGLVALMREAVVQFCRDLERQGFFDIIVSAKTPYPQSTIAVNREIASVCEYPIHIGVTAAGRYRRSVVSSALGIGVLLLDGIGDTIRVSVTGEPVREVELGREILQVTGVRQFTPEVLSCPTCARCKVDLPAIVEQVEAALQGMKKQISIAVMGCAVNGPGEAAQADIGVACKPSGADLFIKGKKVKEIATDQIVSTLMDYIISDRI